MSKHKHDHDKPDKPAKPAKPAKRPAPESPADGTASDDGMPVPVDDDDGHSAVDLEDDEQGNTFST